MGCYEATNAHFHRDYYKRRKLGGILGILVSKYFTGRLGRSESFIPLKKGSLKVHTFKNFSVTLCAVQHGLYTSNLLPTPMTCMCVCLLGLTTNTLATSWAICCRVHVGSGLCTTKWSDKCTCFLVSGGWWLSWKLRVGPLGTDGFGQDSPLSVPLVY